MSLSPFIQVLLIPPLLGHTDLVSAPVRYLKKLNWLRFRRYGKKPVFSNKPTIGFSRKNIMNYRNVEIPVLMGLVNYAMQAVILR